VLCPSCTAAALDAFGRCPHCGYTAAPPAQPYAAYYPQPTLIAPTAPAGIGLATQILLAVAGVFALIGFGANIWAFTVARTAYNSYGANVEAIKAAAGVAGLFAFFSLLLGLATGIVFIVWFYKSANLAAILAPGRQALNSGWAIGGWFIPLGWFVLPRIVAGGIWRAAIPLAAQPVLRKPRTYLVTWWWLSFCVGETLLSTPVSLTRGDMSTGGAIMASYSVSGVADLCRVASAVLGILMIRKLTQMQQIRILQGPGAGHPYAAPVAANVPYAAYTEPTPAPYGVVAPLPGQAGPYGAYGPATGTPYAPSHSQDAVSAAPAPNVPPQAAPPAQESLPAQEPLPPTKVEPPAEAITEVTPAAEAAPEDAVPAVPTDAVPADVPTAVIPRQPQDRATVLLTPVASGPQEPPATEATAEVTEATEAAQGNGTAEPQDAVPPPEPRED
jgi:hypothetical protein